MKLGQTIAEIRKKHGLTQEEMAKEFHVTRQTVSNWENEKSYPDLITLVKISDTYHYSLDRMLKEDSEMIEAMNRSIQLGNVAKKNRKCDFYIGLVGSICCFLIIMINFVEGRGILMSLICMVAMLINVSTVVISAKKSGEQVYPLGEEDGALVKQLIDKRMIAEAVKLVRKSTGLGFVEAKLIVDEIQNR